MKKKEFLEQIRIARKDIDKELSKISFQKNEDQLKEGGWNLKDIIAHISWYEDQMVDLLNQKVLKGSDLWVLDLDERNSAIYALYRNEDLNEIINKESEIYQKLMEILSSLSEDDLNDPGAFSGMPIDWEPWNVIASNTYENYQDHIDQLRKMTQT